MGEDFFVIFVSDNDALYPDSRQASQPKCPFIASA
jgi:hypothetical protein